MCVLGSTTTCDLFDHALSSSQFRILKMRSKDTLCSVAAALAIALATHANAAFINAIENSHIIIDRLLVNMDDKLKENSPSKKQQKLASCATFPQTTSCASSSSTNKDKEEPTVKKNHSLVDYEKRINTLTQIPPQAKGKHVSSDCLDELHKFVKMAESNSSISLPDETMCSELSSLQSKLKLLTNANPRPADFFKQAAILQEGMQRLIIDKSDWQEDVGERGRRIAEWWRSLMVASNREWLPCFERMHIIMSLLRQPSSAIVERVFSQVNCIRSLCGDNLKEDNLEIRTMLRCNGNFDTYDY